MPAKAGINYLLGIKFAKIPLINDLDFGSSNSSHKIKASFTAAGAEIASL